MIPFKHFALSAALAALTGLLGAACTDSTSTSEPQPATDLSKKAKVVTFDVSGMT